MPHDKIKAATRKRMAERASPIPPPGARSSGNSGPQGTTLQRANLSGSRSAMTTWARSPAGATLCSAEARTAGGSRSTSANSGSRWPISRSTCRGPPSRRCPVIAPDPWHHRRALPGRHLAGERFRPRPGGDHHRPARSHPALPVQPVPPDEGQRPDRQPRRPGRFPRRNGPLAPSSASGGRAQGYAIDSFRWGPVA